MDHHKKNSNKIKWIAFSLIFLCVIVGFFVMHKTLFQPKEYHGYYIYGIDSTETKVTFRKYKLQTETTEEQIDELLQELQTETEDISIKKAIPDNVSVEDRVLSATGELSLYFDTAYSNYTGVNEILRRAAIVKTLCQLQEIEAVFFYSGGQPITDSNQNAIGVMTADTFIDNTVSHDVYQQNAEIKMYFASKDGQYLEAVPVSITYDATMSVEEMTVRQLMAGPENIKGADSKKLLQTIPEKTQLNSISVISHTCYIDFSKEFLNKPDDISPEVAIYSVVNTLTELPDINKVQFSIDGEQVLSYNDSISFGETFLRNLNLVIVND